MKALNNLKFLNEATTAFNIHLSAIDNATSYDTAKGNAYLALGFTSCMTVYLNAMIDKENNDFTAELDEVIDGMTADVYQHLVEKAIETNQPIETVLKVLKMRDDLK